MKLPANHPLSQAALKVIRLNFNAKDQTYRAYFDATEEDFTFILHRDGAVVVRPLPVLEERKKVLTLNFKHHLARIPIINVNAKKQVITADSKKQEVKPSVLTSPEFTFIAEATLKAVRGQSQQ